MVSENISTEKPTQFCSPEIWGGIECTINRVKDTFLNQLDYCLHYERTEDIEAIAALGIKKLRYPVLWEKHQPSLHAKTDWSSTEKNLLRLKDKNIDVIAGLVHHGSGPAFTDLLDPQFPVLLSKYAKAVAKKFPWLSYYTPVNEPLTTARFSGLYGIWYPHKKNAKAFLQMLLNQCKGIVLSMKEIRKINPLAQLVQTEDLCKVYSTPLLQYQADFENERRWLTYDLLCGRVNRHHALWDYLLHTGIAEKDLRFFEDNICIPQVFGCNYYVTSERFLDERLHLYYPNHTPGGNQQHSYVDVEAVRVPLTEEAGIERLLTEAWQRYGQPLAITEVHLHCHREEQLRWFQHVYDSCVSLTAKGIPITAVTAWAVLGSHGWNKLLTEPNGDYEPGVFDTRNGKLRPTALASYIKKIATENNTKHRLCDAGGWWKRNNRFIHSYREGGLLTMKNAGAAPILIIGKRGTLGNAFKIACGQRHLDYHIASRQDCDISNISSIETAIAFYKPWAIINAAGYVRVDDAEKDGDNCFRDNTQAAHKLATACRRAGIKLVSFSSDLVFDGAKKKPYVESDAVNPLNVYGQSKAEAERLMSKANADALVIRTSAFFGPWDEYNFIHHVYKTLSQFERLTVAKDIYVSPTYVPDLVNTTLDLLIDDEKGIWHLANSGAVSWAELAFISADNFKLDKSNIHSLKADEMGFVAPRPFYSVLGSERATLLPALENALGRYFQESGLYNKFLKTA